jgi:hypothetical protein
MVLRWGMTLTGVGVVIGVAGGVATSRALVTLLCGVSWLDPLAYPGVIALRIGVALAATTRRRAASVDPMVALRHE